MGTPGSPSIVPDCRVNSPKSSGGPSAMMGRTAPTDAATRSKPGMLRSAARASRCHWPKPPG